MGFPGGAGSSLVAPGGLHAGDPDLIPGLGSSPGEGNGNPLQYSCLENPRDRGAWSATVHGVTKRLTRVSDFTSLLQLALVVKNSPASAKDRRCRFDPGSGKVPWRRKKTPLQYSCLENPLDRGTWQATVQRVAKSQTCLT